MLLVLGICCDILSWHSLGLPYNNFDNWLPLATLDFQQNNLTRLLGLPKS